MDRNGWTRNHNFQTQSAYIHFLRMPLPLFIMRIRGSRILTAIGPSRMTGHSMSPPRRIVATMYMYLHYVQFKIATFLSRTSSVRAVRASAITTYT